MVPEPATLHSARASAQPPRPRRHGAAICAALVVAIHGATGCAAGSGYRGPTSDHFDGSRFHNGPGQAPRGVVDVLRWQLDRCRGPWREWTAAEPGAAPPAAVGGESLRVTFVNHSTLLVQLGSLNVLTDPIWSDRASPVRFAGPRRVRPPGLRLEDLPPIDLVLLSHDHYDHLDLDTLEALADAHPAMQIVTGLGNAALLTRQGLGRVIELDWWQRHELRPPWAATPLGSPGLGDGTLDVWAVPAVHFSGRALDDHGRTLWAGFVLQARAGRVYFAGDTAYGPHFAEIRRRLGAPRLALLPVGAYRPRWFMSPVHMSPDEAVQAHLDLGAATSVATHFGTFPLADDGQCEGVQELARELRARAVDPGAFWALEFGEGRMVPDPEQRARVARGR